MKEEPIARLPTQHPNDEWCTVCSDDNVLVVLDGGQNCHYCGNMIVLCSKCYGRLVSECKELNLGI